ncbi:MAG TPA: hypothetical protein PLH23_13095 [Hyphomonadaceae bacterium]|mgnify:FL=1|nr:hypothetical protein [Hyphomonadaceae bacterium]
MLDKGQIKDWEGEPEDPAKPVAVEPRSGIAGAIFDSHEALPTGERVSLTPEQTAARKRRGQWLAIALFAFVILVFVLTMTKIGANILVRDL